MKRIKKIKKENISGLKKLRNEKRKNKKAQLFGMSFSVIFSIILIAMFIAVAFYAIGKFLEIKKCSDIGMFYNELQNAVDNSWNSQKSSFVFESSLPLSIKYVCFANKSLAISSTSNKEREIYKEINGFGNIFLYPAKKACGLGDNKIKHIEEAKRNPYCIEVKSGKIKMKIEKGFKDILVKIS